MIVPAEFLFSLLPLLQRKRMRSQLFLDGARMKFRCARHDCVNSFVAGQIPDLIPRMEMPQQAMIQHMKKDICQLLRILLKMSADPTGMIIDHAPVRSWRSVLRHWLKHKAPEQRMEIGVLQRQPVSDIRPDPLRQSHCFRFHKIIRSAVLFL